MPVTMVFRFQRATERAICVLTSEGESVWMPKSQLMGSDLTNLDNYSRNDPIMLTLTDWIAREKGIRAPAEEPEVDEDKYTVAIYIAANGQTKFKIESGDTVLCFCDDQHTAQMIAAALALTEGKV